MQDQFTTILESLNYLEPKDRKELFTRLVNHFDESNKTKYSEDFILFLLEDGSMLGTIPGDRDVVEQSFNISNKDELILDSSQAKVTKEIAEDFNLVIIIPPEYKDKQFIMVESLKLTDKQTKNIEILTSFGFSEVNIILPYD